MVAKTNEKRKNKLIKYAVKIYYKNKINRKQKVDEGKYGNSNLQLPTFSGTSYKPNRLIRNSPHFAFLLASCTKDRPMVIISLNPHSN